MVTEQPALILLCTTIECVANYRLFWILKSKKLFSKLSEVFMSTELISLQHKTKTQPTTFAIFRSGKDIGHEAGMRYWGKSPPVVTYGALSTTVLLSSFLGYFFSARRVQEIRSASGTMIKTFTAIVDLSRFNNSCLKSRQRRP